MRGDDHNWRVLDCDGGSRLAKKGNQTGGFSAYLYSSSWSLTAERRTAGMSESGLERREEERGKESRLSG